MELWTEKYRPKKFEDVIGIPKSIVNSIKEGGIPHLLLSSNSPGTGKSSSMRIIIEQNKAECLQLNASTENGVDVVRNEIKNFAMSKSINGTPRIIALEEAQQLTNQAQRALLDVMERYEKNCRFILTCNNYKKLDDALISRCQHHKYEKPKKEDIWDLVQKICEKESLSVSEKLVQLLVDRYYPDMRTIVNKLQEFKELNIKITEDLILSDVRVSEKLFELLQNKTPFTKIRQWVLNENINYESALVEMYIYLLDNKDKFKGKVSKILEKIVICNRYMKSCISQEIEFEHMLKSILTII